MLRLALLLLATAWWTVAIDQDHFLAGVELMSDADVVQKVGVLEVPFGRSAFLDPEDHLNLIERPGDRCVVRVARTSPQGPGRLSPTHFPCNFQPQTVRYTHFGARSPSEDRVPLQVRYDRVDDSLIIAIALQVKILYDQLELVTRTAPLNVDRPGGVSEPLGTRILNFAFDRSRYQCRVRVLSGNGLPPRHGKVLNATGVAEDCDEFLTVDIRYQHQGGPRTPNKDAVALIAELYDPSKVDSEPLKQEHFQVLVRIRGAPENTPPKISLTSTLILDVNQFVMTALTPDVLLAEDAETTDDEQIVYHVTVPPGFGEGQLVSTDDPHAPITAFTGKALKQLLVAYRPPASDSSVRRIFPLSMTVSDGDGASSPPFTLLVAVNPMNSMAPVVTRNSGVSLFEGQGRKLQTSRNLEVADEDDVDAVTITVIGGLTNGRLLLMGAPVKSFSPADLDAGLVLYEHDGSETFADNIVFSMKDGSHEVRFLFPVTVFPVDDEPPMLVVNTGLVARMGQVTQVSVLVLAAADVDSDDDNVRFVVDRGGHAGQVGEMVMRKEAEVGAAAFQVTEVDVVEGDDSVHRSMIFKEENTEATFDGIEDTVFEDGNYDALVEANELEGDEWILVDGAWERPVFDWTQKDLADGRIFYRTHAIKYEAGTAMATSDAVRFRLVDDENNVSGEHVMIVQLLPVDAATPEAHPEASLYLEADEGRLAELSADHLRFTDDTTDDRHLRLFVTRGPHFPDDQNKPAGSIVLTDFPNIVATEFTQYMVTHGKVSYQPPEDELGLNPRTVHLELSAKDEAANSLDHQRLVIMLQPVDNKPPVISNGGINMAKETVASLSPSSLDITDIDTPQERLLFRVLSTSNIVTLQLHGKSLKPGDVFDHSNIAEGHVTLQHTPAIEDINQSVTDVIKLEATDGIHNVPVTFKVTIESDDSNNRPMLQLPQSFQLKVPEGKTVFIYPSNIFNEHIQSVTSTFNGDDLITVSSPPTKGHVVLDNKPIVSFTLKAMLEGHVAYKHSGLEIGPTPGFDSFKLSFANVKSIVSSGSEYVLAEVTIDPVNSASPKMSIGKGPLVVDEGGRAVITEDFLKVVDEDTVDDDLVCTVLRPPVHGFLDNSSPSKGSENNLFGTPVTAFLLSDVKLGYVGYVQSVHGGVEPRSDKLEIQCSDGVHSSAATVLDIQVQPVNDETPEIFVRDLVVVEGMNAVLDPPILNVVDRDEPADEIIFRIVRKPLHGRIVEQSLLGVVEVQEFTLDQLRKGPHVFYEHDDSETAEDSFEIEAFDGDPQHVSRKEMVVTVVPADDETPRLAVNIGFQVDVGGQLVLDTDGLRADDLDTPAETTVFILRKLPRHGWLVLGGSKNLSAGDNFTQRELQDGKVSYVHQSSDGPLRDLFRVDVTDGVNTLLDNDVHLTVGDGEVNVVFPEVIVSRTLVVIEGGRAAITTDLLSTADDDSADENLLFMVTRPPASGRLESTDHPGVPLAVFTQLELAGSKISYVHTGEDETLEDSFEFEVSDGTNAVMRTFRISVTAVDDNRPVLSVLGPVRVREGGHRRVTPFELRADDVDTSPDSLIFTVVQRPEHGSLLGMDSDEFTMMDIENGRISYEHDGSDTLEDSFTVIVNDGTHFDFFVSVDGNVASHSTRTPQKVMIDVNPVDNGVPRLVVNRGVSVLTYVLEDSRDSYLGARLANDILSADDPDSPVSELVFVVTSPPSHGTLRSKAKSGKAVANFTQGEVDSGHVFYLLNVDEGNERATSDAFTFQVVDTGGNELREQVFLLNWAWISFKSDIYVVNETQAFVHLKLRRRGYLAETAFVAVSTKDVTAKKGSDFHGSYGRQVQFSPGQHEASWRLRLLPDNRLEKGEQLEVILANPVMAALEDPYSATVTIIDDEDESVVSFAASRYEVGENAGELHIVVNRHGDLSEELTVQCSTRSGSATGTLPNTVLSFSDFISRPEGSSSTLRFMSGQSQNICRVTIIDDALQEEDESFHVTLSNPIGGRLGHTSDMEVVITADPIDVAQFSFDQVSYTVDESNGLLEVFILRSGPDLRRPASVTIQSKPTDSPSALAGEDYVAVGRTLHFPPGVSRQTLRVAILDDLAEPIVEGIETFILALRFPSNGTLGSPDTAVVSIDDTDSDIAQVEFLDEVYRASEDDGRVTSVVVRTGDIRNESSVRCYSRQATARVTQDFVERPDTNSSVIVFAKGETQKECTLLLVADGVHEPGEEELRLVLGSPTGAVIGPRNFTKIQIEDRNDKPLIRIEKTRVTVKEPRVSGEIGVAQVAVVRTGDLSATSILRIHTKDGSAKSGEDYHGLSRELTFGPNISRLTMDIDIIGDSNKEHREVFTVHLRPDRQHIAETKDNRAIVYIEESELLADATFPLPPIVVSLRDYDEAEGHLQPISGYPLVCITSCDPKHPEFARTSAICSSERIDDSKTKFRWRTGARIGADGITDDLKDLEANTFFTGTHDIVLDSIYLSPGTRIQCAARAVSMDGNSGHELLSSVITVSELDGVCTSRDHEYFGAEPFTARLRYLGPSEREHPNQVRISVVIPHKDGMLPVISTRPLTHFEFILSPDGSRVGGHPCSNLVDVDEIRTKHGFITEGTKNPNIMGEAEPYQFNPQLRGEKTLRFYRNLDLEGCMWEFVGYYNMSELVNECGANIATDGQVLDLLQSFVSLRVPLYVSYVFRSPDAAGGWQHNDLNSQLRLTFVYDTAILWSEGIGAPEESILQGSLYPSSMRIGDDGKLVVNFRTEPNFRGYFVVSHPKSSVKSIVTSKERPELPISLEILRSTLDQQEWQFVSEYSVRDYSGTYEVKLVPCTVSDTEELNFRNCHPRDPLTFELPVRFQQVSDPVAEEFSLNTQFHVIHKRELWLANGATDFAQEDDVAFRPGDTVYGRIMMDPVQNMGSAFWVNVEKCFLCAGVDGYVPKYNPRSNEFGCVLDSHRLQHSFKIIDKSSPNSIDEEFMNVPFNAKLATDDPSLDVGALLAEPGADGFSFDSTPLFQVSKVKQWFLHCIYAVRTRNENDRSGHNKRSVSRRKRNIVEVAEIGRNGKGTNMHQILLDFNKAPAYDMPNMEEDFHNIKATVLPVIIVIIVAVFLTILLVVALIFWRRWNQRENLPNRRKHSKISANVRVSEVAPRSCVGESVEV